MSKEWDGRSMRRDPKTVQIATGRDCSGHFFYALKDDGSIWVTRCPLFPDDAKGMKWTRLPEVKE